jgi:hypothetical protein
MDRLVPRRQILPPAQQALWPQLHAAARLGFVLYGGTAVALRLGHRQSVDFDFFSERDLNKAELASALPFAAAGTVLQDQANTWTLLAQSADTQGSVKVSFFGGLNFGRYASPQWTDDDVLLVASLGDLLATKAKVILQRVEAKDYQDIAAMLRFGARLEDGLAIARQMFGSNFQPSESLKAMTWFEGGDLHLVSEADRLTLVKAASSVGKLPVVQRESTVLAISPPSDIQQSPL